MISLLIQAEREAYWSMLADPTPDAVALWQTAMRILRNEYAARQSMSRRMRDGVA